MTKTGDVLAKMNALDEHGDVVHADFYEEEDVNRTKQQTADTSSSTLDATGQPQPPQAKKRKRGAKANAAPARKKTSKTKK